MKEGINKPQILKSHIQLLTNKKLPFHLTKLQKIPLSLRKHFPNDFFPAKIPNVHIKWEPPKVSEFLLCGNSLSSEQNSQNVPSCFHQISGTIQNQSRTKVTAGTKLIQHSVCNKVPQNNQTNFCIKSKLLLQTSSVKQQYLSDKKETKKNLCRNGSPKVKAFSPVSPVSPDSPDLEIQPLYLRKDFFKPEESPVEIKKFATVKTECPLKQIKLPKNFNKITATKSACKFFSLFRLPNFEQPALKAIQQSKISLDSSKKCSNISINKKASCLRSNQPSLKKVQLLNSVASKNLQKPTSSKPQLPQHILKLLKVQEPSARIIQHSEKISPEKVESVNNITFGNDEE